MQIIFDDNGLHHRLAPLTLTRPVAEIRFGIMTLKETWLLVLKTDGEDIQVSFATENYLQVKFKAAESTENAIRVMGNIKPTREIGKAVKNLNPNTALYINDRLIAQRGAGEQKTTITAELTFIEDPWHIFQRNKAAIEIDFKLIKEERNSQAIDASNQISDADQIFIEPGATVKCAMLNASEGPIYIGKDAEVMEGSMIRGPFALNHNATVKMGAKIYGATTIGPHCKVGGEITNSVFQAYSNKGHDGFLGNSVIGEWCNFGADTNSSNLKNNYSQVKIYSYETCKNELRDVLFCGVIMGDHSKTGINTMLNTATVVGVSSNIFGAGFPEKHVPSFSWGGAEHMVPFVMEKAFQVAENMMARRKIEFSEEDRSILMHLCRELA